MNKRIRDLFAIAAIAGGAVLTSANATDARELILSASVQQIDRGGDTVTVLGQTFNAQVAELNIGEVVKVYGVLQKDGTIKDAVVQGTSTYGANGDTVFVKGVVTGSDPALGRVDIDGMTVDYTSQLADANFAAPNVGDTIEVSGTEPASQGVLMASASGASAYPVATSAASAAAGNVAAGFHSAEIIGGGARSAEIIGGGAGSAEIIGGGARSAEIIGGGAGSAEIIGGGAGSAEIIGGGAGSAEIIGGGAGSAEIIGGGARSAEIIGGGARSAEIIGGGARSAEIIGGGARSAEIIGGGAR